MTAQISDTILYQDESYDIAGIKGGGLFAPHSLGLNPVMLHTACYRGFYSTYQIIDDKLELDNLIVGLEGPEKQKAETGKGLAINDVLPKKLDDYHTFEYKDIGLVVDFSGGLIIARKFLEQFYVHMGFHAPWKYEIIHEFIFDKGRVTEQHDRSKALAKVREKIVTKTGGDDFSQSDKTIEEWINDCFSLDYD